MRSENDLVRSYQPERERERERGREGESECGETYYSYFTLSLTTHSTTVTEPVFMVGQVGV